MAGREFEKYISVPFSERGHTFEGCNCWGLVCLIYKEELGVILPTYDYISSEMSVSAARRMLTEQSVSPWESLNGRLPQAFDVLLMTGTPVDDGSGRIRRLPVHCGVLVSPRELIHVEKGAGVVIMPLSHPRIRGRYFGFIRHSSQVRDK